MLYDAKGQPTPAFSVEAIMDAAEHRLAAVLAEALYGKAPDDRVRELRETILGPQPSTKLSGLAACLDSETKYG